MSRLSRLRRRPAHRLRAGERPRDPYEGLPVDELHGPLLPRWFVLAVLASIPVAIVVFAVAFFGLGRDEVPVAERRPPPVEGLTSDVGRLTAGERDPVQRPAACEEVAGIDVAGPESDRATLGAALDALCEAPEAAAALNALEGMALRFAAFEFPGADVASDAEAVYLSARFAPEPAEVLAPAVAYEAALREAAGLAPGDAVDPAAVTAEASVTAREVELSACAALLDEPSRPCEDAAALLDVDDPAAALRQAGFP